jgi:hypothetical protein
MKLVTCNFNSEGWFLADVLNCSAEAGSGRNVNIFENFGAALNNLNSNAKIVK